MSASETSRQNVIDFSEKASTSSKNGPLSQESFIGITRRIARMKMSDRAYRLMTFILGAYGSDGVIIFKKSTLAEMIQGSIPKVKRSIRELVDIGLIQTENYKGKAIRFYLTDLCYQDVVKIERGQIRSPSEGLKKDEEGSNLNPQRGQIRSPRGVKSELPQEALPSSKRNIIKERDKRKDIYAQNDPPAPKPKKKKSKPNRKFIPPELSVVVAYFLASGYSEQSAIKFFNYYQEGDWHDGQGKQVRNWKMKAIAVWFKDENRPGFVKQKPMTIWEKKQDSLSRQANAYMAIIEREREYYQDIPEAEVNHE